MRSDSRLLDWIATLAFWWREYWPGVLFAGLVGAGVGVGLSWGLRMALWVCHGVQVGVPQ